MPPARRSARTASGTLRDTPYTRANSPNSAAASASIARPANGRGSLKLTVKAAPSKLRQITSSAQPSDMAPNPSADTPSESDATPAPAPRTARSTRNPRTVVEPDSDDVEEEEEFEEEADEDMEGDVDEELADEDSEDDAEGEDEEMEDLPPPPIIKQERVPGRSKPNVTVTAPIDGPLKSVEDKEMEGSDEEELSDLDSDGEGDEEEDEEEEEDNDSDEDDENSRSATPDLTKLTKRQRGHFEEVEASLLSLPNEAQKKKHLTAEEHAMRRAEMARRRKNLSEKRNEEEKQDTINKLLKKPAPKRRTRAEILAAHAADMTPGLEEGEEERADALYVRWYNSSQGSTLGVPVEWLDAPVGRVFRAPGQRGGALVEPVPT